MVLRNQKDFNVIIKTMRTKTFGSATGRILDV